MKKVLLFLGAIVLVASLIGNVVMLKQIKEMKKDYSNTNLDTICSRLNIDTISPQLNIDTDNYYESFDDESFDDNSKSADSIGVYIKFNEHINESLLFDGEQ